MTSHIYGRNTIEIL